MKALRYSLLLTLIHLAISVPVIYHEEATICNMFLEFRLQKMMIAWNPCYEYRASDADRFIFFAEFPAGILIPPHGASACNPTVLRPILQELKNWTGLREPGSCFLTAF